MSQFSLDKFGDNLPVSGVVAFSQVAIGLGVGLLIADRIGQNARRGAAFALLGVGVASLVPVIVGVTSNLTNRPGSSREMRKRLEGIRRGYGLDEHRE